MADKLTAEERAAIEAFPKDQVQRLARGVSGLPINGFTLRQRQQIAMKNAFRNIAFQRSAKRDEEVEKLLSKGLTDQEISQKVKLNLRAVKTRICRIEGNRR